MFDPNILLERTTADCSDITKAKIDTVRSYADKHEDLFAPEDMTAERDTLRIAELLLAARTAVANNNLAQLLDVADDGALGLPLMHENGNRFAIAYNDLVLCFSDFWRKSPALDVAAAYSLVRDPAAAGLDASSADVRAEAVLLDQYTLVLRRLSELEGTQYSPFDDVARLGQGRMVRMLHGRAHGIAERQLQSVKADCTRGAKLASDGEISDACDQCKDVLAHCPKVDAGAVQAVLGDQVARAKTDVEARTTAVLNLLTESPEHWEEVGVAALVARRVNDGIDAFQSAERARPGFHNAREIAGFLTAQRDGGFINADGGEQRGGWYTTYKMILLKYRWGLTDNEVTQLSGAANDAGR